MGVPTPQCLKTQPSIGRLAEHGDWPQCAASTARDGAGRGRSLLQQLSASLGSRASPYYYVLVLRLYISYLL